MFKARSIFLFLIICCLHSCSNQKAELIELPFEQDLFPEGIAIDGRTEKLYLNSLKNSKIVSSSLDGGHPKDFLETSKFGYLAGFGMIIKEDTLYALGNSLSGHKNKSVLLLLQLSTGDLIDSYFIDDGDFHYLNDLVINSNNEIFITDSESNKIYKIQRPGKSMEIYLDSEDISNSNGIAISNNDDFFISGVEQGNLCCGNRDKKTG